MLALISTDIVLNCWSRLLVLSHEELHLASWPHHSCREEEQMELEVLDSQGLEVVVA